MQRYEKKEYKETKAEQEKKMKIQKHEKNSVHRIRETIEYRIKQFCLVSLLHTSSYTYTSQRKIFTIRRILNTKLEY